MIWLVGYSVIGVVLVTIFILSDKFKAHAGWGPSSHDPTTQRYSRRWLLQQMLLPAIGFLIMVLVWPLLLYFWNADRLKKLRKEYREEETRFRIRKSDLVARCSVEAVEFAEKIHDPLGAVPDLPFGHLNAAWVRFLDSKPAEAELWSFATKWEDYWGNFSECRGYVWCFEDSLEPWLITFDAFLDITTRQFD